jgi:hypothetical protein
MRGVVRDVDWPPKLSNVEFVDCRFSPDSLVTVLNSISPDVKHPIALSLDGVALGARESQEFCRRSDTILELSHMIELGLRQPAGLPQSSSSWLAELSSSGFSPLAGPTLSFSARLPSAASAYDLRPTHRTASGTSDRPD